MQKAEERYRAYKKKIRPLQEAQSLLVWDLRARAPKGSISHKLEAIGYFASEIFKLETADEFGEILKELKEPEVYAQLSPAMQLTADRESASYEEFKRVPADFYGEYKKMQAQCEKVWEEAKVKNDFAMFEPWLQKNIDMTTEYIRYRKPGMDTFDALIDQWIKGMTCEDIDTLFAEAKAGLIPMIRKIEAAPKVDVSCVDRDYSNAVQKEVQDFLLDYVGFDFNRGCTGESAHGLTSSIDEDDIRITNTLGPGRTLQSMLTAIHEGGHGIYNQSISGELEGTAAAKPCYSDIHESQSRFLENILGRNINFWKPIYGQLAEKLPHLKNVDQELFERAINNVKISQVRTEADEVTYGLHIILRFELEKEIFRNHVPAAKLRELWNSKMEEMFGIRPESDTKGILQDMHWSSIYWGYFETYLLGSIYDGMLKEAARRDLGDLDLLLAEGKVQEIVNWLRESVMQYGSMYNGAEMIRRVCRRPMSAKPMLKHFWEKYGRIYGIKPDGNGDLALPCHLLYRNTL